MMTTPTTIAGKPLSRFYKLPFEKGSRVLKLAVLEAHSTFNKRRNANLLARQSLSFTQGLLALSVKLEHEEPARVYIWVAYNHLLVSCSVDTDATYLGRYAYHTLRAMMWDGYCDFQEYYWPECFNVDAEQSKYVDVVKKPNGLKIRLKKKFTGLFRPDDEFVDVRERVAVPRANPVNEGLIANMAPPGIGYCFANTDLLKFHTNHFPFLVPYRFAANADGKTVKSYQRFVFDEQDVEGLCLSPKQLALNRICFAMQKIAAVHFCGYGATTETVAEIKKLNDANQQQVFMLWNRALPLLVQEPFKHYLYSYGLRNIVGRPIKRNMEPAAFSLAVPVLSFLLTDKGDYLELQLRLKVKGKVLHLTSNRAALFLVCDRFKPNYWYLLEAEMDCRLVWFFSRVNFRVQVPKAYYNAYFERYVLAIKRCYALEYR